ncbi:hypothetical protein RYB01_15335 [Pseudomonas syringae]|nr:hypothetical protein [Pseudomonas syringae]
MRDLNPLYTAVLQAVEAMSHAAEDTRQPENMTHPEKKVPASHYTPTQLRLHQWVNGDFRTLSEVAGPDTCIEPAAAHLDDGQ